VETESNADPLFQRMCKAFDEGGARGMLLNQLSLGPGCSLLIDSTIVVDDENPLAPSKSNHVCISVCVCVCVCVYVYIYIYRGSTWTWSP